MKTFTVAGHSVLKGVKKLRFANAMDRVKVLQANGHTEIHLETLPRAMTKEEVRAFFLERGDQLPTAAAPAVVAAAVAADGTNNGQPAGWPFIDQGSKRKGKAAAAEGEGEQDTAAETDTAAVQEEEPQADTAAVQEEEPQVETVAEAEDTAAVQEEEPQVEAQPAEEGAWTNPITFATFEEALAAVPLREKGRFLKREVREQRARELMAAA